MGCVQNGHSQDSIANVHLLTRRARDEICEILHRIRLATVLEVIDGDPRRLVATPPRVEVHVGILRIAIATVLFAAILVGFFGHFLRQFSPDITQLMMMLTMRLTLR